MLFYFSQTIWKAGYNEGSVGDAGTLYHGKVAIQSKNVPDNPMKDINATNEYLQIYTESLVVAATLHFFGMDSPNSDPTTNTFHPPTEPTYFVYTKVGELLDKFAIPSEDDLTKLSSLLCPECSAPYKTMAPLRKHIVDKHQPGMECTGQKSKEDGIFNYSCSMLGMCLLSLDFEDARKHADGTRIMLLSKYLLLYFKEMKKPKYAYHVLRMLCQVHCLLTPREAYDLTHNRFVNTQTSPSTNKEPDRCNEHSNRGYKTNFRGLHGKVTTKAIHRISRSSAKVNKIMAKYDKEGNVKPKSKRRHNKDHKTEVLSLSKHMNDGKIFACLPEAGRYHRCFPGMKKSVLATINHTDLSTWIRTTFKKISRSSVFKQHNISTAGK